MKTATLALHGLFISMALILAFPGCISTRLAYNPNLHQTGRTAGQGVTKFTAAVGESPSFLSGDTQDGGDSRDAIYTKIPDSYRELTLDLGARLGLGNYADIGGGLCVSPNSFGGRVLGKFQTTERSENLAVLMPAVVVIAGSQGKEDSDEDDPTDEQIDSWLTGIELHVPISYRTGRRTEVTLTPRLIALHYTSNYESSGPDHALHDYSLSVARDLVGAGLGLGFRWGILHPEVSFSALDNAEPLYSFGVAVHN